VKEGFAKCEQRVCRRLIGIRKHIVGYAHSALRKSTTWLKYRCNKLLTPDTIFFPNQIYLDYFENKETTIKLKEAVKSAIETFKQFQIDKICGSSKR
jgi:hypothetical protein